MSRADLSGFRDYNTDDGEEWWQVDISHAIEAVVGEMKSWPTVRVLVPDTGEVFQGRLMRLIDRIAENVSEGRVVRVEPKRE